MIFHCFLAKSWPEYIFTHSSYMKEYPNTIWDISKTQSTFEKWSGHDLAKKQWKIMHYWDPGSSSNSMNSLIFLDFRIYDSLHFYLGQNNVWYYEKLFHGQPSIKDFNFGHHCAIKWVSAKSWPRHFGVKLWNFVNWHDIACILTFSKEPGFFLGQVLRNIQESFFLGQKMSWPMGKSFSYMKNDLLANIQGQ